MRRIGTWIKKLFKKPFIFPNYLPTKLEIFDRVTDENMVELKGNEEEFISRCK